MQSWLTAAIPMDSPYCSCKLTEGRRRRCAPHCGPTRGTRSCRRRPWPRCPLSAASTASPSLQSAGRVRHYPPKDDPNHLGLRCNALPEHHMARLTLGLPRAGAIESTLAALKFYHLDPAIQVRLQLQSPWIILTAAVSPEVLSFRPGHPGALTAAIPYG